MIHKIELNTLKHNELKFESLLNVNSILPIIFNGYQLYDMSWYKRFTFFNKKVNFFQIF